MNTEMDTGVGLDHTHKKRTDPARHFCNPSIQSPGLLEASKRMTKSGGISYHIFFIIEFRERVSFLLVRNLAVDCQLGSSYIDHHVTKILPGLKKAVLLHLFLPTAVIAPITRRDVFLR